MYSVHSCPVAKLVSVLADPIFSREQCSSGSLCMRWHPAPPIRLLHTFCAQGGGGGAGPHSNFYRGAFLSPGGGLFRSNFNPKNHNFSDDFPVIFWYIHMMLLHLMTLTSNLIIGSGMWT